MAKTRRLKPSKKSSLKISLKTRVVSVYKRIPQKQLTVPLFVLGFAVIAAILLRSFAFNLHAISCPTDAHPTPVGTQLYGTNRGDHLHAGIDIVVGNGQPVYAALAGNVIARNDDPSGYGIYADLIAGSTKFRYAHLSSVVAHGPVARGQLIGYTGGTGNASEAGVLHFEMKPANGRDFGFGPGTTINPIQFYAFCGPAGGFFGPSYSPPAPVTKIDTGKNCLAYIFPDILSRAQTEVNSNTYYCVRIIQQRLAAWGYKNPGTANPLTETGLWDNPTAVDARQFQVDRRTCLSIDGRVGPQTWQYLMGKICGAAAPAAPAPKPPSSGGGGPTYSVSNRVPVGWVDNISCNQIKGWAFDPDTTNSIYVHIYVDGPAGGSPYPASSFLANFYRPDVNNAFKSKYGNIGDNHGFEFSLPSMYRNGQNHGVWVYAIDSAGGTNVFLKSGTTGPC